MLRTAVTTMLVFVFVSALTIVLAAEGKVANDGFELNLQRREPADGALIIEKKQIHPAKTAIVVIDMWDRHWCRTYTARVANMVPRMNRTLEAARRLGIQVVFAPSDVVDFYKDFAQRKSMQAIADYAPPAKVAFNPPSEPKGKDCCECGPAQPCKTNSFGRWSRQHPDLKIAESDLIGDCNNERELLNFCRHRGIDTLIYMGVASNMCVLHRKFGMLNMGGYGFNIMFVSDMVQAITANGLDPATKTPDWNFTPAKGSALIQRYLEKHIAPSFESRQLIGAAGLNPFAHDKRPHIVFVIAEQEYKSNETLPAFAKAHLEKDFRCTFLFARADAGEGRNDVPGLESLYDADLLVLSMRRRALPVTQMDHLERYIRSGKPFVGIRVSVVPFQVKPEDRPDGHVIWRDFDRQVLGCQYAGYDKRSRQTGCDVWIAKEAGRHPILHGIDPNGFHSPSWIYKLNPLAEGTTLLMEGRWSGNEPVEPVAFTNTFSGTRAFFTSLGHPDDFRNESFCKLLVNGVHWALEMPVP
ncbi:MAG TPA: ThuA domain-containing protein [Sedimentisphaerales bacterium]|nr:ThuA domain-containing protein [Sedimentisphaerales bacterium]